MVEELNRRLEKIRVSKRMWCSNGGTDNALAYTIWKLEIEAQQLKETIEDSGVDIAEENESEIL